MQSLDEFLNGRITLHCGDCLNVLATLLENSIDSCVTDPPYHLVSIVQRYAKGDSKTENSIKLHGTQKVSPYARGARGFMGKQWDGGNIAQSTELWSQVYRVLKPGAHLLAFGGTRTYHRMACAIEDAGFEIRDCIQWLYGSGFPKSHDVSKGIDRNHHAHKIGWFGKWLREERARRNISQKALAEAGGFYDKVNHGGLVANWELGYGLPTAEDFNKVCQILNVDFPPIEEFKREVIGRRKVNAGVAFTSEGPTELDITIPNSAPARQWQGWGTALKPACEPIVLARKPLSESTVASNVLKWGTGAINVDGCRVEHQTINGGNLADNPHLRGTKLRAAPIVSPFGKVGDETPLTSNLGRWPANVIHDGSEEVAEAFPETQTNSTGNHHTGEYASDGITGWKQGAKYEGDEGSAARFFYTAKADSDDRLGSKHPTVKPLDLMQYLVRLVTPKGGTVLDPFAGTGTTGEAAWREGMSAVLIEREAEYQADIRRRIGLCLAGPDERQRESIKAKMKDKPQNHGPLFNAAQ